jgi:acetoin:2,6-dichlorophenolindophenol oxidoreductase subunit beta
MPEQLAGLPSAAQAEELTYSQAVNAALRRALSEWPSVLVYGEDVALPGGVFGVTRGLRREFGDRVFDTPISESAILGSALGAALVGMRPVVEIMWVDFALVALDQLVNQAANARYVSRGSLSAPLVVRTQQGTQLGACAQHSQSLEAFIAHVPGLRLCLPATPQDAYDLLLTAIETDDPVVVIENRNLYLNLRSPVALGGPVQGIGGASVRRAGDDITVVTWGAAVCLALQAAESVAGDGISVEVIDARWLDPFDRDCVLESAARTRRLVVAHEANRSGGFGAEVVAQVVEAGVGLSAPPRRVATPDTRIPAAPTLLSALVPSAEGLAHELRSVAGELGRADPAKGGW